jgi:hypothetical protein
VGLLDSAQRSMRRMLGLGDGYASQYAGDHLAEITLEDWLGALPDYVAVNRKNAITVASVDAARNAIAPTIGRIPFHAEKGGRRVPQAQQPALLVGPLEAGTPRSTTMTWTVDALFFQPCTWWVIRDRDFYGWPRLVEWISLDRAGLDKHGRLVKVDKEPVAPEAVIRFDSPLGEGFLVNAAKDIRRAIAINLAASKAEDSPIPAVELHNELGVDLSETDREALLDKWSEARRKRGVAYTPKGIKVIPHGKPADALLIDGRKQVSLELLRHASVPAWAASTAVEGATMNYENRSSRNWELLDLTLSPYITAIEERLSLGDVTPNGWTVKANTDDFTRDDMKTRFEAYEIGKRGGFVTNEWIAEQEGWADVPADTTNEEEPAA